MPSEALVAGWDDLVLPLLSRPGRYQALLDGLGPEPANPTFDAVVVGPDLLEALVMHPLVSGLYFGLSGAGGRIDLAFLPERDYEGCLATAALDLRSLRYRRRLAAWPLWLVPVTSELQATGVVGALRLAGVPVYAAERRPADPIVVGLGPGLINPEPTAPFFDAVWVGDTEPAIEPLAGAARLRRDGDRPAGLEALGRESAAYLPGRVAMVTAPNGMEVAAAGTPPVVAARAPTPSPMSQRLRPLIEVRDASLEIEVMRGCPRSCRFCAPARTAGPVREQSPAAVAEVASDALAMHGWEELTLGGVMPGAWSALRPGVAELGRRLVGQGVAVGLSYAEPASLEPRVLTELSRVRRTALHLAPEAGSERLRQVLGKPLDAGALERAVRQAADLGWPAVRLHFMVGLPTEESEDLAAIVDCVARLRQVTRQGRTLGIHLMIHPFVPRSHTPFQWEAYLAPEEIAARVKTLRSASRRHVHRFKWGRPEMAETQAILARGDRRLAPVIERAWALGARLEDWSEHHRPELWRQALSEAGLTVREYTQARTPGDRLPWAHLDYGLDEAALAEERRRGLAGEAPGAVSPHRPIDPPVVGPSDGLHLPSTSEASRPPVDGVGQRAHFGRRRRRAARATSGQGDGRERLRLRFEKGERLRFLSHLDVVRVFDRALRQVGLPVAYSAGYSRHPKLSFGPPLPVGMTSVDEYLDLELVTAADHVQARLNSALPAGVRVLAVVPLRTQVDSLMSFVDHADYRCQCSEAIRWVVGDLHRFRALVDKAIESFVSAERVVATRRRAAEERRVDLRAGVRRLRLCAAGDDTPPEVDMSLTIAGPNAVRPLDVAAALLRDSELDARLLRVERLRLYRQAGTEQVGPIEEPERAVLSAAGGPVATPQSADRSVHVQRNRYQRRSARNKDRHSRRW